MILIFYSTSCSESGGVDTVYSFEMTDLNEVLVSETVGGPKYPEELFHYEYKCSLNETPDNPDSYLRNPRTDLATDGAGKIFVADSGNERIAVFDTEGTYLFAFGREGSGPGEFQTTEIQQLRDGVLSVWDYSMYRISYFTTEGTLIDVITPRDRTRISGYHSDESGLAFRFYRLDLSQHGPAYNGNGVTIFDSVGDTLIDIRTPLMPVGFEVSVEDYARTAYWYPYTGQPIIYQSPIKEILVCNGDTPEVKVFDPNGSLSRIMRIHLDPLLITKDEEEHVRSGIRSRIESIESEAGKSVYQALLDNLQFPEQKGFAEDIFVDTAGFIWIQYPGEKLTGPPDSLTFRILSPQGEYLGDTTIPVWYGRVMHGLLLGWNLNPETGGRDAIIYSISSRIAEFDYPN